VTDAGRPIGKAVAIDLGTRRIGIAVSNSEATMAFPREMIERSGDNAADLAAIAQAVRDIGATTVVVGLPLSLDGTDGPAARSARDEAGALGAVLPGAAVVLFDGCFTTVLAQAALSQAGRRGRAARSVVDSAAASVLLQSWLDAGRPER
jgi:putative holliday junction resolvase